MTDTPRAWTNGKWWVEPSYTIQCVDKLWNVSVGNTNDCLLVAIDCEVKADADLIALSPQMAEAILAWDEHDGVYGYGYPAVAMMREVVEELRAIGHDDD